MNNFIKKNYCNNCGKYGHNYNKCIDPITSIGIIAVGLDSNNYNLLKDYNLEKVSIIKENTVNNNIFYKISKYIDNLKFILIRRRKTLGYLEFIRGRYCVNNEETIINLFNQMTEEEVKEIIKNNFDSLWQELWNNNNKYYVDEFNKSKIKFNKLKENKSNKLLHILKKTDSKLKNAEWGFPKGRRLYLEKDINCAIREFKEETNLSDKDFFIMSNVKPIQEIFLGTNNIKYKHIYYIAICKNNLSLSVNNDTQRQEIGDIGFFNYKNCLNLFRSFHIKRRYLLNEVLIFISNLIENLS